MKAVKAMLATLLAAATPGVAFAQEGGPGMGVMGQVIFFGGFILIFYLLIWRPQSKRAKEHKRMLEALRRGDEVITQGGLYGKVTKVKDDEAEVEIADGVRVRVVKGTLANVVSKTEPANDA